MGYFSIGLDRGETFMSTEGRDKTDEKELTEEELQEFMASYKKELAHIYKTSSAKKAFMARQHLPNLKEALEECDREMRDAAIATLPERSVM